jgi:hypothetical protein
MKTPVKELYERLWEAKKDKFTWNAILEEMLEKEKEQIGYTKADVIKAGEMGEINYLDTLHIVTYLDEAKKYNETLNTKER